MSWFRVDDSMLRHPKWVRAIQRAGSDAVHLWLALGTWSSEHLTDGVVPTDMLHVVGGPCTKRAREKALRALIECQLVHETDGRSLKIHDYLDYNPSREEVESERDRWAQSKRNRRLAKNVHAGLPEGVSPGVPGVSRRPDPARPTLPDRELSSESSDARARGAFNGVAKTYELTNEEPSEEYLAECVFAGVSPQQARSTWKHYFTEGLPDRGVQRLVPWLVDQAKGHQERRAKLVRREPSSRTQSVESPAPSRDGDQAGWDDCRDPDALRRWLRKLDRRAACGDEWARGELARLRAQPEVTAAIAKLEGSAA